MSGIDAGINSQGGVERRMFGKLAPAAGANDLVVTATASSALSVAAGSYSGVLQSGLPDSSNTGFDLDPANSPLNVATTVVASNCWLIGGVTQTNNPGFPLTAGTGTSSVRSNSEASSFWDSNGVVGTGAQSLEVTWTGTGDHMLMGVASIAPAADATATRKIRGRGITR